MTRSSHQLLLIASVALLGTLTACVPGDQVGPQHAEAARVVLTDDGATSLVSLGDSTVVTPHVLDRDGKPVSGVPLRWSLSAQGVLQDDGGGVYHAVGNGHVAIIAQLDPGATGVRPAGYWVGPIADSVVVEVQQRAARLALIPVDTAFGTLGAARQLGVQVTDARGNPMVGTPPRLTWHSENAHVVTVDSAGVVRSSGEGAARITVQADSLNGSVMFSVHPRLSHTSCMIFLQRHESRQSCVTLGFVVHEAAR